MATGVVPSDNSSSRVQITSKMSEVAPVRKKAHSNAQDDRRILTFILFGTARDNALTGDGGMQMGALGEDEAPHSLTCSIVLRYLSYFRPYERRRQGIE